MRASPANRGATRPGAFLVVTGALAALGLWPVAAQAPAGIEQRFDKADTLTAAGWTVEATPQQSEWRIRDGVLEAVCHRSPYKGGRIVRPAPRFDRGTLEFDAQFALTGGADYNHLSLGVKLYGHMTAFKHYGGHLWMAYRPGQNAWLTVSDSVPLHQRVHLRIVFDGPAKRAEYYWGEGEDPVYVDKDFSLPADGPAELEVFNYGLCSGTVTHALDNIVLRPLGVAAGDSGTAARTRVLLFQGFTAARYRIAEHLAAAGAPGQVSVYTLQTHGSAIAPRNQFRLDRLPALQHLREAACIVLVDVPAGPGNCLPPHLLGDIATAVADGAHLVVFGGLFALGKGAYAGTPLATLIPAAGSSPWEVRRFDRPQPLVAVPGDWPRADIRQPRPAVLYYHEMTPGAVSVDTVVTAGGKPLLLRWRHGRGQVSAFLGAACGAFPKTPETLPFWESADWPAWVARICERPPARE